MLRKGQSEYKTVSVKAVSNKKRAKAIERATEKLAKAGYEVINVTTNQRSALTWGAKKHEATITARRMEA